MAIIDNYVHTFTIVIRLEWTVDYVINIYEN